MANFDSIYPITSPYHLTDFVDQKFLDVMVNRPVPKLDTDVYWIITATYNLRPDLLAHDLYNNSKLWWVFAQRNPNTLPDPLFDFITGKGIFLPTAVTLQQTLGV